MPDPRDAGSGGKGPRAKHHVFLVAVERHPEPLRVYAVMAETQEMAMAITASHNVAGVAIEVAGKLSKLLARRLKLTPGDLRQV